MNPAQEFAKAAETLDAHQVTMVPGLDQALALVLRGASDTIDNNVTRRLPDGLPVVPVSPDLLDLARLINASPLAESAPVVNRERIAEAARALLFQSDDPSIPIDEDEALVFADRLFAAGVFSEPKPVDREALEREIESAFVEMAALHPDGPPFEALVGQIAGYVLALINGGQS